MKTVEAAAHPPRLAVQAIALAIGMCLSSMSGLGRAQTTVRDVDRPTRQPFQAALANQLVGETPRLFPLVTVPLGKRLVIEHASATVVIRPTPNRQYLVQVWLRTQVNGQQADHMLILDRMQGLPTSTADIFQASQPIRIYADPGTTVSALVSFHTGSSSDDVDQATINRLSISGHFVDER